MKTEPLFFYSDGFLTDKAGIKASISPEEIFFADIIHSGQNTESLFRKLKADRKNFLIVKIYHSQVEPESGQYNEAFLAGLRDFLKAAESQSVAAVISFSPGKEGEIFAVPDSPEKQDDYIEAAAHTARRLKDCAGILGFLLPPGGGENFKLKFAGRFSKKHPHFIFFLHPGDGESSESTEKKNLFAEASFLPAFDPVESPGTGK